MLNAVNVVIKTAHKPGVDLGTPEVSLNGINTLCAELAVKNAKHVAVLIGCVVNVRYESIGIFLNVEVSVPEFIGGGYVLVLNDSTSCYLILRKRSELKSLFNAVN